MAHKALIFMVLLALSLDSLAAGRLQVKALFKDKAMVEFNGRTFELHKGKEKSGLLLISADSKQAVIRSNGEEKTYGLATRIGSEYAKPEGGHSIQVWPDPMGMYMVNGSINGFQLKFLIDTGATTVAMNSHQAKRMGLNYKLKGIEGRSNTASGVVRSYFLKLDRVRVGEIELRNVPASVIDGSHPKEVLLGQSFLNQLVMTREGKMMELTHK